MTLNERDKKILIVLVPVMLVAAYWFLLLAPKKDAAAKAETTLQEQTDRRDAARERMSQASSAKTDFAADYGEIVRLGKAIPARVDMPSLLVQLDRAAEGTGIHFTKITTGERSVAGAAADGSTPPPAAGSTPSDAGGAPAQSAPGSAAENANEAAATATDRNAAAEQSGVDATTSTTTREGGLPVGGAAGGTSAASATAAAPAALETVPLTMEFVGDFFKLADFFHDVKRLVDVVETNVIVNGRLVTIETVKFNSDPEIFPRIKAQIGATIYLSPQAQGATAGATPQGPAATTTPASTGSTPAPSDGATPAPTAAVTP